jgi:hypothetical protein
MRRSWQNVPTGAKMYQIKRRQGKKIKGVSLGKRVMEFKNQIFHTKDHRLAQDIQDKYPNDVMAIPHDSWKDDPTGTHRHTWSLHHMGDWKANIDWGHE